VKQILVRGRTELLVAEEYRKRVNLYSTCHYTPQLHEAMSSKVLLWRHSPLHNVLFFCSPKMGGEDVGKKKKLDLHYRRRRKIEAILCSWEVPPIYLFLLPIPASDNNDFCFCSL
jgi:hypothetical protein